MGGGGALRRVTAGGAVGALVVVVGFMAGSGQLADNSFLTHLATGRIWFDGGGIPRRDPYTFTAAGEPWVVQSWLASLLYAGVEEVGGLEAVRLLMGATTAALAAVAWALSRPAGSLTARVTLIAPVLVVGFLRWAERPLLLGLLALGLVLLAGAERIPAWLCLPILWFWVNVHGSWPLGIAALALAAIGGRLDGRWPPPVLRALRWTLLGALAGAIGPYGPRILTFPVELLARAEALSGLKEWKPASPGDVVTLACLGLGAAVVVGLRRRFTWQAVLPAGAFLAAGLASSRNLLPACLVLVAAGAPGLQGLGTLDGDAEPRWARGAVLAAAAVGLLVVTTTWRGAPFDDSPFPVAAEAYLRDHDLDPRTHRIVARELVGNWLEARYGPTGMVYMDDRVEVLPLEVVEDHRELLEGGERWEEILEATDPDAVLWQAERPLAGLLEADEDWDVVYEDERWIVAVPD